MSRDLEYGDLTPEQRGNIEGTQRALGGDRGFLKRIGPAVRDAIGSVFGSQFGFDRQHRIYTRRTGRGEIEFSLDGKRAATPEELEAQGGSLPEETRRYINSLSGRRVVSPVVMETTGPRRSVTEQMERQAAREAAAQPATDAIPEDRRMVGPTGGEAADARQSEGARSPFVFDSQGNAMVTVEGVGQISQQDLSELSLTDLEKVAVAVGLPRSAHTNEIRDALRNARRE